MKVIEANFILKFPLLKNILIINILANVLSECDRAKPILKNGECVSTYCTEEQFKTGECVINEPITKKQWLNNIIKFEKTNGDISLIFEENQKAFLIFSSGSSDNKEKIYFAIRSSNDYIFKNGEKNIPYIKKNITEGNEMIDPQLCVISLTNKIFIISIGRENTKIGVLELYNWLNDYLIFNSSSFLGDNNRRNEGIESFAYILANSELFYSAITTKSDEPSNYYFYLYHYAIEYGLENQDIYFNLDSPTDKYIDMTKSNYASCIIIYKTQRIISCFYLSKENFYTISNIETTTNSNGKDYDFIIKNKTIVGAPSKSVENELFFFKAKPIGDYQAIYSYFSGNDDNIPTFLIRKIDSDNYSLENIYQDFPAIYLYDYMFDNKLKYNDIALTDYNNIFFVSTNNNKDLLIIANIYIYTDQQLIIRYNIIKLQEYYYMKILNGLKAVILDDRFLTIAFDFCYNDQCHNSDNDINNAGLIFLSYLNHSTYSCIDFIDYAFEHNKNYVLINFQENTRIENNIFGYSISNIYVYDFDLEDKINYYNYNEDALLEFEEENEYEFAFQDIIKVEIKDYSQIEKKMLLAYYAEYEKYNINEYNKLYDKINDTLGNKSDINSLSLFLEYGIDSIYQGLSEICIDEKCILCLENNKNYCLVCIDDNYMILYGDNYTNGKLKLCTEPETETTVIKIDVKNEIDSTMNVLSTNINIESTYIKIPSTNVNIESTYINILSTNINIESTNIDIPSISIKSENEETQKITDISKNTDELSLKDLFEDKYNEVNLSDEQIKEIYNDMKDYINNNYNGENTIINTGNLKIQLSTLDSQLDSELSNVNLGECEEILKEKYCKSDNDSLIILKLDITPENEKSTYVQYEVYLNSTKQLLNLNECSGTNVIINTPIELDLDTETLYDTLAKSGYNLFDSNDSFYNDICAVYTTENDTDILLYDRRMDIYQKTLNISLCQEGCQLLSYNSETKKAECNCQLQTEEIKTNTSELEFEKNDFIEEFYDILKNSNFRIMKCYKLPFNPKIFIKNIGSILMTIILVIFLILIIYYFAKSSKNISIYIKDIIKLRISENSKNQLNGNQENINKSKDDDKNKIEIKNLDHCNELKEKDIEIKPKIKKSIKKRKKKKTTTVIERKKVIDKRSLLKINNNNKNKSRVITDIRKAPPKRRIQNRNEDFFIDSESKNITNKINDKINNLKLSNQIGIPVINNKYNGLNNNNNPIKNNVNSNLIINSTQDKNNILLEKDMGIDIHKNRNKSSLKEKAKKEKRKKGNEANKNSRRTVNFLEKNNENQNAVDSNNIKHSYEKITDNLNINNEVEKLNDQEMNTLEYEKAIELDKRNYFQYYYSLLKKKQLILFTFLPTNDYNIMALKIGLFIVSFCLYITIDAFFFSDETMHKIYKDNGSFNILYQIPQILYSSIIPTIINMILKTLSLTEKDLLKIKQEKDIMELIDKSKKIEKCIYIKFVVFFFLSVFLMLFFWYFISCFCAVYNNTQIILIKDSLISFGLSMLYPFGLNLIPGLFRIPALRAEKKDKKCLYKASQYIALI